MRTCPYCNQKSISEPKEEGEWWTCSNCLFSWMKNPCSLNELIRYFHPGAMYLSEKGGYYHKYAQKKNTDYYLSRIYDVFRIFINRPPNINPRVILVYAKRLFDKLPTPELKIVMWDLLTLPECDSHFERIIKEEIIKICNPDNVKQNNIKFSTSQEQMIQWSKERLGEK
jgi:hypothetical protein